MKKRLAPFQAMLEAFVHLKNEMGDPSSARVRVGSWGSAEEEEEEE